MACLICECRRYRRTAAASGSITCVAEQLRVMAQSTSGELIELQQAPDTGFSPRTVRALVHIGAGRRIRVTGVRSCIRACVGHVRA